jgi:hypothetical protein
VESEGPSSSHGQETEIALAVPYEYGKTNVPYSGSTAHLLVNCGSSIDTIIECVTELIIWWTMTMEQFHASMHPKA